LHKTAVYTPVNGVITLKNRKYRKGDIAQQYVDTYAMSRCVIRNYCNF